MPYGAGAASFVSIELAYHAFKMLHLVGGPRVDIGVRFAVGGVHGRTEGAAQKALGGKGAFKKLGIALNVAEWNAVAPGVMRQLVEARAAVDSRYVETCAFFTSRHITIRHFAHGKAGFYRSKTTNALVGRDMLGPLLVEVGTA